MLKVRSPIDLDSHSSCVDDESLTRLIVIFANDVLDVVGVNTLNIVAV